MPSQPTFEFEDQLLDEHVQRAMDDQPIGHFSLVSVDELIGGIHRGRVIVIGGVPGSSKTTFSNQLADDAAAQGFTVVFFSLEMPPHWLVAKSITRLGEGGFTLTEIGAPEKRESVEAAKDRYRTQIAGNICYIETNASSVNIASVVSNIEAIRGKPVILFIDYVQIMRTEQHLPSLSERQAVMQSISALRELANNHDTAVFAISSIGRQHYAKATPGMEALGECSQIEYTADIVLQISTDGATAEQRKSNQALPLRPIQVTAVKNRYGGMGTAKLTLDCAHATFTDRA